MVLPVRSTPRLRRTRDRGDRSLDARVRFIASGWRVVEARLGEAPEHHRVVERRFGFQEEFERRRAVIVLRRTNASNPAVFGIKERFDDGDVLGRQQRLVAESEVSVDEDRSEEQTSEIQSLMRISYAVFCLKNNTKQRQIR